MPIINKGRLQRLAISVPSLPEQRAIVARIETAFAALHRVEAEAKAAERALDRLDQAILAKAFRGELVPQDPADQPASALLARIAAERAATPKPARGRRRSAAP
jgi:type I restriction enzyme S subunit